MIIASARELFAAQGYAGTKQALFDDAAVDLCEPLSGRLSRIGLISRTKTCIVDLWLQCAWGQLCNHEPMTLLSANRSMSASG